MAKQQNALDSIDLKSLAAVTGGWAATNWNGGTANTNWSKWNWSSASAK